MLLAYLPFDIANINHNGFKVRPTWLWLDRYSINHRETMKG